MSKYYVCTCMIHHRLLFKTLYERRVLKINDLKKKKIKFISFQMFRPLFRHKRKYSKCETFLLVSTSRLISASVLSKNVFFIILQHGFNHNSLFSDTWKAQSKNLMAGEWLFNLWKIRSLKKISSHNFDEKQFFRCLSVQRQIMASSHLDW